MSESTFASLHDLLRDAIQHGLRWDGLRPVQELTIEAVRSGANVIVLAPTAGGKTEAALLPVLDALLKRPSPGLQVLYVCPLRALLNNLEGRVQHLCELVGLRAFKWHGEVEVARKGGFLKDPADVLLTTPESLEAMLISPKEYASALFSGLRFIIVDEVHAFAGDDRGAHLLAVIERIARFSTEDPQRIALSATVGNPEHLGEWLRGSSQRPPVVVAPPREPGLKVIRVVGAPPDDGFAEPAAAEATGRKLLFFVGSRRQAEAAARALRERLPVVFVHHSSVSRQDREAAETAFTEATEAAIVCTSTLELGIDVGNLDLVQQLEAPHTVSSFLQRLGRTGRRRPPARLTFYTTSGATVLQAAALVRLAKKPWVESVEPSPRAFHVLVHQILTNTLERPGILASELFNRIQRAWPFSRVKESEFLALVRHLVGLEILSAQGGTITLGPEGERRFGRRNYFGLFAVFEGAREIAVKDEQGDDIGTLQTSFVLANAGDDFVFRLSGRTWQAVDVNLEAGVVRVRPAPAGKLPRWVSPLSLVLSRQIMEEERRILRENTFDDFLTDSARHELVETRAHWARIVAHEGWPVVRGRKGVDVYTFAGGKVNLTLAKLLEIRLDAEGTGGNDHFTVKGDERITAAAVAEELARVARDGIPEELGLRIANALPRRKLSKFQALLPPDLEAEFLRDRLLDVLGAQDAVKGQAFPILDAENADTSVDVSDGPEPVASVPAAVESGSASQSNLPVEPTPKAEPESGVPPDAKAPMPLPRPLEYALARFRSQRSLEFGLVAAEAAAALLAAWVFDRLHSVGGKAGARLAADLRKKLEIGEFPSISGAKEVVDGGGPAFGWHLRVLAQAKTAPGAEALRRFVEDPRVDALHELVALRNDKSHNKAPLLADVERRLLELEAHLRECWKGLQVDGVLRCQPLPGGCRLEIVPIDGRDDLDVVPRRTENREVLPVPGTIEGDVLLYEDGRALARSLPLVGVRMHNGSTRVWFLRCHREGASGRLLEYWSPETPDLLEVAADDPWYISAAQSV